LARRDREGARINVVSYFATEGNSFGLVEGPMNAEVNSLVWVREAILHLPLHGSACTIAASGARDWSVARVFQGAAVYKPPSAKSVRFGKPQRKAGGLESALLDCRGAL
jgi:hypothetical protein